MAVVGTGTGVGKTWVTAELAKRARSAGRRVALRKPAQSFSPGEITDAQVLAAASGERAEDVCPPHRWYERAYAPPMAAEALGRQAFSLAELIGELRWPEVCDLGLVETVGGVRSPLAADADAVDLLDLLQPDAVVLVADAGLGTLNAVQLSLGALAGHGVVVLLNRFDAGEELHRANRVWLDANAGTSIVTAVDELERLVAP